MPVLAVIPARLGATRLPRKPLQLLAGLPLVVRVWQQVSSLGVADHVVVATDSTEVMEACAEHGALCILTAEHHPSGTDRVSEVAERPEFCHFETILNVQGDEPFVDAESLAGAVGQTQNGFELGTVAAPLVDGDYEDTNVVKVVCSDTGGAMYFSRAAIPHLRDRADAPHLTAVARRHIGVYAYQRDALLRWVRLPPHPLELIERLEQLRPLAAGLRMGVALIPHASPAGIDTPADLSRANDYWMALHH